MLAKEVVASRLDAGISFTEFSYQILQSIDFEQLFMHHDVQLQIGGADQWGNITAGIDTIHKIHGSDARAYGLTIPLMLKSDGTKFGKTAGGAEMDQVCPHELRHLRYAAGDRTGNGVSERGGNTRLAVLVLCVGAGRGGKPQAHTCPSGHGR